MEIGVSVTDQTMRRTLLEVELRMAKKNIAHNMSQNCKITNDYQLYQ